MTRVRRSPLGIAQLTVCAAVGLLAHLVLSAVAPPAQAQPSGIRVVVTYSVLGDVVRTVGGDRIDLRVLVAPDSDAHSFEPTPADARALAEAALVFENGLNFETWLDPLFRASRSSATRVVVTQGLEPLAAPELGHRHGDQDPHMWHDVTLAAHMAAVVRDALVAADPANADVYQANADRYLATLAWLDGWVFETVQAIPPERRKIVTPHNTFAYFARRYGFEFTGSALASISTEAQPTAQHLASLVTDIRAAGVPAIFPENVAHQPLMELIAAEADMVLAEPLCTDALGRPESPASTYVDMTIYNVNTLVRYLRA